MERDRSSKVIAIIALFVAVVGLSLGFATFSSNLKISQKAEVKTDPTTFKVLFSSDANSLATEPVTATTVGEGVTAQEATISNASVSAPTITGLKANLKRVGDSVTYTFYVRNEGDYDAYLKSITFGEVESGKTQKCTAKTGEGATEISEEYLANLDTVCSDIKLSVKVGSGDEKFASAATITGHKLAKKEAITDTYEQVTVKIEYTQGTTEAASYVDGDFEVAFGDITLAYSSAD